MTKLSILILDDEARIRDELDDYLSNKGYQTYVASTPTKAMEIIRKNRIDLAIIDINLPEKDGLTVLQEIKDFDSEIEVIIITGQGDMQKAIQAMRHGATDFFNKPIQMKDVLHTIERTRRYINLAKEFSQIRLGYEKLTAELRELIGAQILGNSEAIKTVLEDIRICANHSDLSVLISGESGTGKELVARSIHYLSERKNSYFYAVNCAAIPENLFESEFFGYVKGAFTGAINNKPGWFEIAHKGTLFLDEIAEMSPMMQAKLLRVTEDGKVHRIGSNQDLTLDVRLISATNQDISRRIKSGEFRQDLFHRLNTFQIKIAPVRDRKEDIPILVEYFIGCYCRRFGKKITSVAASLMNKLVEYSFPGNVRELKNMLERAVIICNNSCLTEKYFAPDAFCMDDEDSSSGHHEESFDLSLVEQNTIIRALKRTEYNKQRAAKLLNISWQSLQRLMQKYNL